jgi:hypothetical protein
MSSGRLTHATRHALEFLAQKFLPPDPLPNTQCTGRHGEEDVYFYLHRQGYIMVARNFCSPNRCGEIDLIVWDKDVLCFRDENPHHSRRETRSRSRG